PDEADTAVRAEHARELTQRHLPVEPVERLRADDDIGASIRQRERFGLPFERRDAGDGDAQVGEHLRERLDRRHAMAERHEPSCQLPRPATHADDARRQIADEPAHRLDRVLRPCSLVRVGDVAEGGCAASALVAVDDHAAAISAATPCMPTKRGTTSSTLVRAQRGLSAWSSGPLLMRFRPLRDCRNASSTVAYDDTSRTAASAASVRSQPSRPAITPATYASSSANAPLTPAQTSTTSSS